MNVLVFDIETVPDVEAGRRLYELTDLSDKDVGQVMFHVRKQESDTEFLRHHLHRIVAISAVLRSGNNFKVWSLGTESSSEKELIERFYDGVDKFSPTLVSWNGGGFDLPVLHYRALLHGVAAPRYWDTGDGERDFRYNNYLSRFHQRHTDLMDVLAAYQPRASAPLHEIALMNGFPGKLGMDGSQVWDSYQAGEIVKIREYCETDVLNTYLVFLRYELIRGKLSHDAYDLELQRVRDELANAKCAHFDEFLRVWSDVERRDA